MGMALGAQAFDHAPLLAERDRNLDSLLRGLPADLQLLLEDEPFLDHENFFEHRYDHHITLGSHRRGRADLPPDGNARDLDGFPVEGRPRDLLGHLGDSAHPNLSARDAPLFEVQLLFDERNDLCCRALVRHAQS